MHNTMTDANFSLAHDISHVASENYLIHCHPFYELYYFIEGSVYFLYDGTEYLMEPDTLIIIVPNVFHGIKVLSDAPYERYTMHFMSELIPPERREALMGRLPTEQTLYSQSDALERIWPANKSLGLRSILGDFDRMVQLPKESQSAAAGILVESVLMRLNLSGKPAPASGASHVYQAGARDLDEVLTYIHTNLTQKLSLEDISNRFFISKNKLNQGFSRQTGFTVMEYVNRCRLKYAQQLLLNGLTAAEACQACGYGDYTAFYRAYTRLMGHSPKSDKREIAVKPQTLSVKESLNFKAVGSFSALHNDGKSEVVTTIWDRSGTINISAQDPAILRDKA